MGEIIKHNFLPKDWCVPERCPCLTCPIWLSEKVIPNCACKPCEQRGLRRPEDVICYRTTNGEFSAIDINTGNRIVIVESK